MIPTKFSVVIVGCGNIAGSFDSERSEQLPPLTHAGAYSRHGGFHIVACVEPDIDRRNLFQQRWGVEIGVDCIDLLVSKAYAVDVISICSPSSLHILQLRQAIELRPKVIFCEKPLTFDVSTSREIVELCRKHEIQLFVNFSRNWDISLRGLATQLASNEWGKVRSVVCGYNKGIVHNGSHMMHLLVAMFGELEIHSVGYPEFDHWSDDPTVASLLYSKREKIPISLTTSDAADFSHFELEVICELGVIRMLNGGAQWHFRKVERSETFSGYKSVAFGSYSKGGYIDTMANAIKAIYSCLNGDNFLQCNLDEVLYVQKLCTEIQQRALVNRLPSFCNEISK